MPVGVSGAGRYTDERRLSLAARAERRFAGTSVRLSGNCIPGILRTFFIYVVIFDITTIARYNKSIYLIKYLFDS